MSQEPRHPPPGEPEGQRDVLDQLKMAGVLIAGIALILFFFQNLQHVQIHFLWFDWNTQMIWALIASAALGAAGVFLALTIRGRRGRKAKERSAKQA
jgi:uncharacterized integral membrane protein